ncbi:MAG: metallophosphoesterase, partial [Bacilli bacterium]|nr:metallophosphoesterase [Bacilli bacterium]
PINGSSIEVTYSQGGAFSSKDNEIPAYTASGKTSSSIDNTTCRTHKVHVENLEKGQAYSYKIGAADSYAYGAFIVEGEQINNVTAVHMSDAQTKDPSKHNVWRNTFTKAVDKAGDALDTVLYNGDQFDQNMEKLNSSDSKNPSRILRYAKAYDVISDYKASLPYMASAGNHERTAPYCQYLMSDIDYAGYGWSGAYYSYDYGFAHFTVINSNDLDTEELNWVTSDLESASNAKWKVVMLHISPYSTGDNSNSSDNQKMVEKLTPIFSEKHVDLVLQAHDHTYNKTKPYKCDAAGYTTTWDNEEVVNFSVEVTEKDGKSYDKNPNGTYYVTTGAAGHRSGASEADGVWSEVTKDENGEIKGLNPSKTFLSNKYKIEVGTIKYENQYESYTVSGYTSAQDYHVGDPATGNVNAQMFGVLNLDDKTLSYDVYTVNSDEVKLFDSLDIMKD